ncbi:gastrula zinc finger protein XlCGF26.1-like isoform X2 [Neocloeon triangulifer]|nr:gastrula zinc finger protein XlCGF26.1-like isoform X2 [Neocloeon triangulifer]XP_059468560.1 gastrula zinc finger protein XlCGF26.1-like isoform X2 [Neocloeon triangulifer]
MQDSHLFFYLDPGALSGEDWPIPGNTTELKFPNDKCEFSDNEDEFVDVEGDFADVVSPTISNSTPVNNIQESHLRIPSSVKLLESNPHTTSSKNGSTVFYCVKCQKSFDTMEECQSHMFMLHDWAFLRNRGTCRTFPSQVKHLKISMELGLKKRSLALNKVAKPIVNLPKKPEDSICDAKHKPNFSCQMCTLNFKQSEQMDLHMQCHSGRKQGFLCPECNKYFSNWVQCSSHLWAEHKIDTGLFSCDICNMKFPQRPLLINHMRSHVSHKKFACDVCNKKFHQHFQLKVHKQTHLPIAERWTSRTCQLCKRVYSDFRSLKKHKREVHGTGVQLLCTICGFSTTGPNALRNHQRSHSSEKRYHCDQCDFKTAYQESLRRHKMLHSEVRKYHCPFCESTFIQSTGFKSHILLKHPGKTGVVFNCSKCSFTTVNPETLEIHSNVHKNEILEANKLANDQDTTLEAQIASDFADINFDCLIPLSEQEDVPFLQRSKNESSTGNFCCDEILISNPNSRPPSPSILEELPAELVEAYQNSL